MKKFGSGGPRWGRQGIGVRFGAMDRPRVDLLAFGCDEHLRAQLMSDDADVRCVTGLAGVLVEINVGSLPQSASRSRLARGREGKWARDSGFRERLSL